MKHWSIKWRVLGLALLPPAIIAALLTIYFADSRVRDIQLELRERGQGIARLLAPASEHSLLLRDRKVLQSLTDLVRNASDIVLVTIADSSGELLAVSGNPALLKWQPKLQRPAGGGVTITDHSDFLVFTAPIYQSERQINDASVQANFRDEADTPKRISIIGWSAVSLSKQSILSSRNELLRYSLLISLLVCTSAVLLALRIIKGVTRPVDKLVSAIQKIGHGNLQVEVDVGIGGEIGALAEGINNMAASLKSAQENLQEKIDLATEQLTYQASHDTLTGLINRREFEARLEHAVSSAQEHSAIHALCFLDLDQFKVVNDSCGHEAGDQLLRNLGYHLRNKIRDRDTLARLGGDEFVLLLENCSLENALDLANELLVSIRNFRFSWEGKSFVIGCSIGLVPINRLSESVAGVLSNADAACYTAKDLGRNRVYVFQPPEEGGELRPTGTSWVTRINKSLEDRRFSLFYQPIVPLGDERPDRPRHYEALLRMRQDNGDIVLPMSFIPAAERYNLMQVIDRWVVEAAFVDYRRLMEEDNGMSNCVFSINLSGSSMCDEKFPKFLEHQFSTYQIPPQSICFEITETAAVTNLTQALTLIQQQKRIGCRFMLDDFGSGLSSFTYLKNLPVDGIKIDGAFVKDMVVNSMDAAMVEAINNIGHVMGLITVAEYVEDQAVMQKLRDLKVDYAQGDWVRPPMALEECFNLNHASRSGQLHEAPWF